MKRKFSSKGIVRRILEGYSREGLSFTNRENTEGCLGAGRREVEKEGSSFQENTGGF